MDIALETKTKRKWRKLRYERYAGNTKDSVDFENIEKAYRLI